MLGGMRLITMNFRWTDEAVEELRLLWVVEGLSASQAATLLNAKFCSDRELPLTRNAVIGKVHRLKWPERDADTKLNKIRKKAKARKSAAAAQRPPRAKPAPKALPPPKPAIAATTVTPEPAPVIAPATAPAPHLTDTLLDRLTSGPGCFVAPVTLETRVFGKQCCYPHPQAAPSSNMQVCGAETEPHRQYCNHHRQLLGGVRTTAVIPPPTKKKSHRLHGFS